MVKQNCCNLFNQYFDLKFRTIEKKTLLFHIVGNRFFLSPRDPQRVAIPFCLFGMIYYSCAKFGGQADLDPECLRNKHTATETERERDYFGPTRG